MECQYGQKMISRSYDTIVVGSGLCAYAFLLGSSCSGLGKALLVTSDAVMPEFKSQKNHPKLYINSNNIAEIDNSRAFCSHAFGGFSNSWGGVLVPVSVQKLEMAFGQKFAKEIQLNYKCVIKALSENFDITKFAKNNSIQKYDDKSACKIQDSECLLLSSSSADGWSDNGLSIAEPLKRLCEKKLVEVLVGRVTYLSKSDYGKQRFALQTSDGEKLFCKNLVLAAGFVGNRTLASYLTDTDENPAFVDHTPRMLLCVSVHNARHKNLPNAPIEFVARDKSKIMSFYGVSKIPEVLLDKIGTRGFLIKILPKFIKRHLMIVQCWNEDSVRSFDDPSLSFIRAVKDLLDLFSTLLFQHRTVPIFFQSTEFGLGFHYMRKTIKESDSSDVELRNMNDAELSSEFHTLGGFSIKKPFFEHPTLAFMSHAYTVGRKYFS